MYIKMLENLMDGVIVRDAGGNVVLANRVALQQLGFERGRGTARAPGGLDTRPLC